ncbi:DUF2249 domain-containing protein [Fulvimonas soli]|jgi:hypothetical protein|uniref:Uncharacterized protein DUF2249 n=1 Tax=Fulvimonas soli TaxID=155197 RepID=A0A316I5N5_9GAMM|nr:DUF2249 domain-containing protein [Fulvimonas soli]PWK85777.1 uncharacterized protein DUF2249 [Fulvimonas soli]TNY25722.1 hypothetical protein BV497_12645 [Fulvimonas soli]
MPTGTCHSCRCHDAAAGPAPLDLRRLPAPEPLQRALAAADALLPGQSLRVLTPLLPAPLLDALAQRGLHARAEPLAEGGAQVTIRRDAAHGPAGA